MHRLYLVVSIVAGDESVEPGKEWVFASIFSPLYAHSVLQTEAKDICLTLAQAFEAVFNKIKLEQNLHASELR